MATNLEHAVHLGLQAQQAGDLQRAEQLYREVLAIEPSHANAWHLWGAVAFQNRDVAAAIERMRRAVQLQPDDPQFHSNLGFVLMASQNPSEAEESLRTALQLQPQNADTWFKLGNLQMSRKEHAAARASYRRAIELDPRLPLAYSNWGASLADTNELQEAVLVLKEGIRLAPEMKENYVNLACVYERLKQFELAEACFRRILVLSPRSTEHLLGLTHNLIRQKRHEEALQVCQLANTQAPEDAVVWRALGVVYSSMRRNEEAEYAFRESLRFEPDEVETLINHCIVLHDLGRLDEAIRVGQRATQLNPNSSSAYDNVGAAYSRKGEYDRAFDCLARSIEIDPKNAMTHFHLGLTLMALGRFEEGWREYEWRFDHPLSVRRECESPRWQGEPLAGRSILLQAEQGFGDALQFIRYAKILRDQGARIILECSPALIEFFTHCHIVDELVSNTAPLPYSDFHCPLMSLGHVLQVTPTAPSVPTPYLFAEVDRVAFWRPALKRMPGLKVGIAWQGDPKHTWDRFRSLRLDEFARLASVPGVTLVSVQRGAGEEQLATARFPVRVFQPQLDNNEHSFRDTAAVLGEFDVLISADTAVAHLAGGMGVRTWLLLNAAPDWRWGLSGESTPWYPSLRLFRQKKLGDWTDVFEDIARELAAMIG